MALCTTLATNLISFTKLRKRGIYPGNNYLRHSDRNKLSKVSEIRGQQVLEYKHSPQDPEPTQARLAVNTLPIPPKRHIYTTWTKRKPLRGHLGPEALQYLATFTREVQIKSEIPTEIQQITTVNCNAYRVAKARQLYSKKVKVIKCNNKITTTHPQVYAKIVQQGIQYKPSTPNIQA
ncbi:hypothetical protein CEK25_006869 [Fusarium fujikuroi]|nr:hypothetical protein CEK25_006869 [Fusarium fujikuroi]